MTERRPVRRPFLLTVAMLGGVLTLVGASGVLSVFTDRATTGTNSVQSSAVALAADLKLAAATLEGGTTVVCGTYSDDLATPLIVHSNLPADSTTGIGFFCLKNEGRKTVSFSVSSVDVVDVDVACTGDESGVDATCGADQAGELAPQLTNKWYGVPGCVEADSTVIATFAMGAQSLVRSIGPGESLCFGFVVDNNPQTENDELASQSDRVQWRYQFDGSAA